MEIVRRKLPLLAIYDVKTGLYDPQIITTRHVADSLREFAILKNNPETRFGKNPEDFALHKIGDFEDETGTLTPHNPIAIS